MKPMPYARKLIAIVWEGGIRTKATLVVGDQPEDCVSNGNACTLQRCGAVTYRPADRDWYRLPRASRVSERSHLGGARDCPQCNSHQGCEFAVLERMRSTGRGSHIASLLPPNVRRSPA